MSTLYILLPSKAAADAAVDWTGLSCPFALVSHGTAIEREGSASLTDFPALLAKAQRIVLLLAASDVTLLRVQVPPLSAARLKATLPGLVEDQLITDPADCVMVAGPSADGLRTVAVVDRSWLERLAKKFTSFGARHIAALPAQLCLPYQEGAVAAAITERGDDIDVALRLSEHNGIGLPIMPEQAEFAAREAVESLSAIVPQLPITLYVPQPDVPAYQEAVQQLNGQAQRISVFASSWSHWLAGVGGTQLDLMSGLSAASASSVDWRPWRWPLILASIVLLINVVGLNIDWWRMKREAESLRATMTQIYKSAYPKDTVIVDPLVQMRQKIAAAKRDSGQAAPDDFTALAAVFGEAWTSVIQAQPAGKKAGIAAIEYRERSLFVRLKPEGEVPTDQMKAALAARNLTLDMAPSQSAGTVWQIRSAK